ncbi:hypothetical protein NY547_10600 [Cnuibacter physcomitrellae]|uniref:hypothetical protein n=1 Tax=Cnuibacter physcomitrellae TaxID=1619308 RepID=UPI002175CFE3|nr:hypothetical protein [Cnuibacter physcomitrellae]MCS5497686.1 hypothetical protein [Cnuibacter physcomitrellae]
MPRVPAVPVVVVSAVPRVSAVVVSGVVVVIVSCVRGVGGRAPDRIVPAVGIMLVTQVAGVLVPLVVVLVGCLQALVLSPRLIHARTLPP